mgnify:CR=1 FL=1
MNSEIEVKKKNRRKAKWRRLIIPASFLHFLLVEPMFRNAQERFEGPQPRSSGQWSISWGFIYLFMKIWFGLWICMQYAYDEDSSFYVMEVSRDMDDYMEIFWRFFKFWLYIWGGIFISCDAYMLCTTFLMAACFTRRSGNAFSPLHFKTFICINWFQYTLILI